MPSLDGDLITKLIQEESEAFKMKANQYPIEVPSFALAEQIDDPATPLEDFQPVSPIAKATHNYSIVNASVTTTAKFLVTNGNHKDQVSGNTIVPTISGVPINNSTPPLLTPGGSDTLAYFHGTASGGATSSIEILSGASVPTDSSTSWYQKIADFIIKTDGSGNKTVVTQEGGVSGSQAVQYCSGSWLLGLQ